MDGKAHGETPRLVAFESRLLGGQRNQAWKPPPPTPVEQWPELPPGREYMLNEQGEVVGIQATEEEHRRNMAEARRQWEAAEAERIAKLPVYQLPGDSKIKTAEAGVTELPGIFQAQLNDFYRKRKAENYKLERAPFPGEFSGGSPIDQLNPVEPELELPVKLRTENQNRTVLELFQFLNFIEHADCQYAMWRDKAGNNGFRPIRFKHELDEIPKRLRQWKRTVALIQENLELWPNIVRLRTLAEAEGKSLNADWFRQWKAKRAIELGFDSVDGKRLSEVVGGTVTPLEVGTVAVGQNEPESKDLQSMLMSLPRSQRNALRAFEYAQEQRECELTYGEAWEYLNEYGFDDCEDLRGYKLPLQNTFENYVAKARKALGTPRNTPRAGRKTRSTVRADEI